jgi:hypothetical protein
MTNATLCTWHQLTCLNPPQPGLINSYPYPFTGFGGSTLLGPSSSVLVGYGGASFLESFFNNALLCGRSNKFLVFFNVDSTSRTFSWTAETRSLATPINSAFRHAYFPPPPGSLGLTLSVLGDSLLSFGGFSSLMTECLATVSSTSVTDEVVSGFWSPVASSAKPTSIIKASIVVLPVIPELEQFGLDSTMFLMFGGQSESTFGTAAPLWFYRSDISVWYYLNYFNSSLTRWPSSRWSHSAIFSSSRFSLLVFGGQFATDVLGTLAVSADLWECTISARDLIVWNLVNLSYSPPPRYEHSSVETPENHMLIFGGFDSNNNALNDVWMLVTSDPTLYWMNVTPVTSAGAPSPSPRGNHVAAFLASVTINGAQQECMLVYGGSSSIVAASAAMQDVWCLQRLSRAVWSWVRLADGPLPLQSAASTTFANQAWFVNGGIVGVGNSINVSSATHVFFPNEGIWASLNTSSSVHYFHDQSPAVFYHSLVVKSSNVTSVTLAAIGGQSLILEAADYFLDNAIVVYCTPGTYSTNVTQYGCRPCPVGAYADSYGLSSCKPCPDGITTAGISSTAISQCVFCDSMTSCHGNGDCYIDSGYTVQCSCHGWYRYSESCRTAVVGLIVGVIFAFALVGLGVFFYYRKFQRHISLQESHSESLKDQLLLKSQEGLFSFFSVLFLPSWSCLFSVRAESPPLLVVFIFVCFYSVFSFTVLEMNEAWRIPSTDIEMLEKIGAGASGMVRLGIWKPLNGRVAIKIGISDMEWDGIMQEIDVLKTIRHPNIVRFIGAGNFEDGLFCLHGAPFVSFL